MKLIDKWRGRQYRREHGRDSYNPVFAAALAERKARRWVAPRIGGYQATSDAPKPATVPPGRGSASPRG